MVAYPIAVSVGSLRTDSLNGLFDGDGTVGAASKGFHQRSMHRHLARVK